MTEPTISVFGDSIVAVWPGTMIACEFSRFTEHRDSLTAEVTISNETGQLYWGRLNLAAPNGRREVVRELEEIHPIEGWTGIGVGVRASSNALRGGEAPEAP